VPDAAYARELHGRLIVFSRPPVSAAQEVIWYALYGALLWAVIAIIAAYSGIRLRRPAISAVALSGDATAQQVTR
jgi:hypothetical protein